MTLVVLVGPKTRFPALHPPASNALLGLQPPALSRRALPRPLRALGPGPPPARPRGSPRARPCALTSLLSSSLSSPQVTYTSPSGATSAPVALTDSTGAFTLDVPSPEPGATVLVSGGACTDAGTGLSPPVALGAVVPSGAAPFLAVNGITTLAFYTAKNAAAPQVAPYLALMGGTKGGSGVAPSFDASAFYAAAGAYLKIPSARDGAGADLLGDLLATGSPAAAAGYTLSTQVLAALAIGSQGLAGLKPDVTPDAAAEAMVVATFPAAASTVKAGSRFDLTQPAALAAITNKALAGAPADVVGAVAAATADLNSGLAAAVKAAAAEPAPAARALALAPVARGVRAAQDVLGPAARGWASGNADDFAARFGSAALVEAEVESVGDAAPGIADAAAIVAGRPGEKHTE